MSALHDDEVGFDVDTVGRLVDGQFPTLAGLPLTEAGHGTDNRMFRLGKDLAVRLPRTPGTAATLAKELAWLPRIAGRLPVEVPEPVGIGGPDDAYPFTWAIYRWIPGEVVSDATVDDWPRLGRDVAAFVRALHAIDVGDTIRGGELSWYRGDLLAAMAEPAEEWLRDLRALDGLDLDVDAVEHLWHRCLAADEPDLPHVLTHADLRTDNLLVRDGSLAAVIDFGSLAVGNPTAVHAAAWGWPADARSAYREELGLDADSWLRATGWSVYVNIAAIPYYWRTWPDFAQGGVDKLRTILAEQP